MADVALRPTFPEAELKRLREERLTSLSRRGRSRVADPVRVPAARLRPGASLRHGRRSAPRRRSRRSRSRICGSSTRSRLRPVERDADRRRRRRPPTRRSRCSRRRSAAWKGAAAAPAAAFRRRRSCTARKVYLVDKPGAPQSQIRIGWIGVPRSTPDYFPLRVLNTILGGSFTSRLNQNLREEHGYAYGASSTFDMRAVGRPVLRGRRRADRQDRRGAEGVLQRA